MEKNPNTGRQVLFLTHEPAILPKKYFFYTQIISFEFENIKEQMHNPVAEI